MGSLASPVFADAYSPAQADENSRWYITAGAQKANIEDLGSDKDNYTIDDDILSTEIELELENGTGYGVGVGYELGSDLRVELNYTKIDTEVDWTFFNATYSGVSAAVGFDTSGDAEAETFMLSMNKDFPSDGGWTPYVGAGIGRTNIDVNDVTFDATELGDALEVDLGTTTILKGDSNTVWAYQLRGGIAKDLSNKASLYAEVNYNVTDGFKGGEGATEISWDGLRSLGYGVGFRYKL